MSSTQVPFASPAPPPALSPFGEESARTLGRMAELAEARDKRDAETQANFLKALEDLKVSRAKDPVYHQVDFKAQNSRGAKNLGEIVRDVAETDWEKAVHKLNDEVFIRHMIAVAKAKRMNLEPPPIQSIRGYDQLQSVIRANVYAPDTSGAGQQWSPTGVSASYIDYFRITTPLVNLIPSVDVGNMQILNIPIPTTKTSVTLMGSLTGTTPFAPQGTGTINNPTTGILTLAPKRHATDVLGMDVMEMEDSPVSIIQMSTTEAFASLADAQESGILNGDVATTGIDQTFGPANANGYGTATTGIGIRAAALTPVANLGDVSVAAMSLTKFETNLKRLGHYGLANDGNVISVLNAKGYWDLATDSSVRNWLNMATRGPMLAGSLGKLYNSDIFVSNQLPDVAAATGRVASGAAQPAQSHIVFNRTRFRIGMKRTAEILFQDPGLSQALQWRAFARHCIGYAPDANGAVGSWIAAVGTYTK